MSGRGLPHPRGSPSEYDPSWHNTAADIWNVNPTLPSRWATAETLSSPETGPNNLPILPTSEPELSSPNQARNRRRVHRSQHAFHPRHSRPPVSGHHYPTFESASLLPFTSLLLATYKPLSPAFALAFISSTRGAFSSSTSREGHC